jgi:uncharacterized membrane protein
MYRLTRYGFTDDMRILSLVTAIAAFLTAGVFFGFSTFVMPALRRLPATQGIAAMNAINRAAPNPPFMLTLFGSALACCVLAVSAGLHLGRPGSVLVLLGSLVYVAGTVLTIVFHIPRNDALGRMDPDAAETVRYWAGYAAAWTTGNHVRTLSSLAGAVLLVLGFQAR